MNVLDVACVALLCGDCCVKLLLKSHHKPRQEHFGRCDSDVVMKVAMRDDADDGATLAAGSSVELLDEAGDWLWITRGPEGPSGYVRSGALAPRSDA